MGTYNVVDSIWFSVVGIVRVRTEYDGDKFYIGAGSGANKELDEQYIARFGMPVYPELLSEFFDVH